MIAKPFSARIAMTAVLALCAVLAAATSATAAPDIAVLEPGGFDPRVTTEATPDGRSPDATALSAEANASARVAAEQGVVLERAVLKELDGRGNADFWVVLDDRADLSGGAKIEDWVKRGQYVYDKLVETAKASQAKLIAGLTAAGVSLEPFWIANTVLVHAGDQSTLDGLLVRPEVAAIRADQAIELPKPVVGAAGPSIQAVEWGIANVRANDVWSQFDVRGEGIVVGNIDTGVDYTHSALVNQYRGNAGGGSFNHNYNWWDPSHVCLADEPCDNNKHGTHTMGTMVGDDGAGNQIGVAPGARWIAAKGCESGSCSGAALLSSAQFMLAPTNLDGTGPRPDLRAHVVNNSWGSAGGRDWFDATVDAWVAAGMFPVFANGNSGPFCDTADSPGDAAGAYAVGAHDSGNTIASFSSRGPGRDQQVRPNISAPGVKVRSSVPGGYANLSGTSMAAPHLAGTVALMWSASGLVGGVAATREALDATAIDTEDLSCGGTPANNNVYGQGRLDALEATIEMAIDSGVTGTVLDADTGQMLAGVTVKINGSNRERTTDQNGQYTARVRPGSYILEFSRFGYITQTISDVVVTEDALTTVDVKLPPAPSGGIAGTVTDAVSGHTIPGVTVEVQNVPVPASVTTDAEGSYKIPSLPVGTYELVATSRLSAPVALEATVSAGATTPADWSIVPSMRDVQRVSVGTDGAEANGGSGEGASAVDMSADGRYIAFHSLATNLADQPTRAEQYTVYIRDRDTGVTELVSVTGAGEPADDHSTKPSMSAEGRYVAFASRAKNLTNPAPAGGGIYVHDRVTRTVELVSVNRDGHPANNGSDDPAITADGRYVAFSSSATNLVADDSQATCPQEGERCEQVYVHDRVTGSTELVSRHRDGHVSNGSGIGEGSTQISPDGRYVVWQSAATNLVDGETNPGLDIFVHDRETAETAWVSVLETPGDLFTANSGPRISDDGRFVTYNRGLQLAALYDRVTGETHLLSVPLYDSTPSVAISISPVISGDGRTVIFTHLAFEGGFEVPVPEVSGVFALDRASGQVQRLLDPQFIDTLPAAVSGDARFVAAFSHLPLVPEDSNDVSDMFVIGRDPVEAQARFAFWDLTVEPATPLPGQPIKITAKVKNVGNVAGARRTSLRIDERVEGDMVTVAPEPGQVQELSWTVTRHEGVSYRAYIAGTHLTGEFRVQSGTLFGTVSDANNDLPVEAVVTATNGDSVRTTAVLGGTYQLPNLQLGTWKVVAAAENYVTETFEIKITEDGQQQSRDVALRTGVATVSPEALEGTMRAGASGRLEFTLANAGSADLSWNAFGWEATTADSPSILVYADDYFHRAPDTYIDQALRRLGLDYTLIYGHGGDLGFERFQSALADGDWDLVIFANEWLGSEYSRVPPSVLDALNVHVEAGGRLIVYARYMGEMASHPLWESVGVEYKGDSGCWSECSDGTNENPPDPVHWWQADHTLVTSPFSVPEFTDLIHEPRACVGPVCFRYGSTGVRVDPLDGFTALGGATEEHAGLASVVLGNDGRTLFRGFADGHNEADLDRNGIRDGVELWVNSVVELLDPTVEPWLEAEGSGILAPGGSARVTVSIDATHLEPGTYTRTVTVVSDAAGAPLVRVPLTVTVTPDACPAGYSAGQNIVFGDQDSGVPNYDRGDGCTFLDLVWAEAPFGNQGQFVETVRRLAEQWQTDGRLTKPEVQAIHTAAARSDIGGGPRNHL